jgi:hypothetical protein
MIQEIQITTAARPTKTLQNPISSLPTVNPMLRIAMKFILMLSDWTFLLRD